MGYRRGLERAILLFLATGILDAKPIRIRILHTNDIHGYISGREQGGVQIGGMALLAGALEAQRARAKQRSEPVLYLDGGDLFKGTPVVDATRGRCMIDLMNRLRLDAMVVGNHEFDYGVVTLAQRLSDARFAVLGANLSGVPGILGRVEPNRVFDLGGVAVGVFGLVSEKTPQLTSATEFLGLSFDEALPVARSQVAALRDSRARIVLALSHRGLDEDREMAGQVAGLDGIIGGHSHSRVPGPIRIGRPDGGRCFVVQAGSYAQNLGWLLLVWDPDKARIVHVDGGLLPLEPGRVAPAAAVSKLVESYEAPIRAEMAEVVGELAEDIPTGIRGVESPIGSFVAEAFRSTTGADVAFANFGGFRTGLSAGIVTRGTLHTLVPFGNELVRLRMTGAGIRAMLSRMVDARWELFRDPAPGAEIRKALVPARIDPGFLVPAGLTFTFDPRRRPGQRMTSIATPAGPLEPDRVYQVVVADFLARGGDGFSEFAAVAQHEALGLIEREAIIRYLRTASPVSGFKDRPPDIVNLSVQRGRSRSGRGRLSRRR